MARGQGKRKRKPTGKKRRAKARAREEVPHKGWKWTLWLPKGVEPDPLDLMIDPKCRRK